MAINPFTIYFIIVPGAGIFAGLVIGLSVMWSEKRARESEEFNRKYEKFKDFNVRMLPSNKTKERLVAAAFILLMIYALIYGLE